MINHGKKYYCFHNHALVLHSVVFLMFFNQYHVLAFQMKKVQSIHNCIHSIFDMTFILKWAEREGVNHAHTFFCN